MLPPELIASPSVMFTATIGVFWAIGFIPLFISRRQYHLLLLTSALYILAHINLKQQDIDLFTKLQGTLLELMLLLAGGLLMYFFRQRYSPKDS